VLPAGPRLLAVAILGGAGEEAVDQLQSAGGEARRERGRGGGQAGLGRQDEMRLAVAAGIDDPPRSPPPAHRGDRQRVGQSEPRELLPPFPLEQSVDVRARAHQPGTDGGDPDTVPGELQAQGVGQSHESVLARAVGRHVRDRHLAADRGDVDDPPLALPQMGERCADEVERPPEVHLHGVLEILQAHVLERAHLHHASVVDQDVEAAEALDRGRHGPLRVLAPPHVAGQREDPVMADRRELAPGDVELVRIARQDREARPLQGELAGDEETEAARAPGDQGHAVPEVNGRPPAELPRGGEESGADGQSGHRTPERSDARSLVPH
jgi:hypothetical protein